MEEGEATSFESLRLLENRRAKARVSWRKAIAAHDQHILNLAEAREQAQKLEAKLQVKITEAEVQIAEKKAVWDELEKSIAEKASEHSKLASCVGTGKGSSTTPLTEKQKADGAAKVWNTLEAQLSRVLGKRQLEEGLRSEVQACVAEAVLGAKICLHDAEDEVGSCDEEMDRH